MKPLAADALQRKMNGNMDSAKRQSDIIHDIEILCECVVSLRMYISLYMISHHVMTIKVLKHSKNVKEYPL